MVKELARQYTIRSIPSIVDQKLRELVRESGKSFNQIALEVLSQGAGESNSGHHDLDFLIGSWVHDDEVEKALKEVRVVDPKEWK